MEYEVRVIMLSVYLPSIGHHSKKNSYLYPKFINYTQNSLIILDQTLLKSLSSMQILLEWPINTEIQAM